MKTAWRGISAFGRFWYGFIIGDDWAAAAGVLVMLGAAYGLRRAQVPAWWAGPLVILLTLMITLRRAASRPDGGEEQGGVGRPAGDEKRAGGERQQADQNRDMARATTDHDGEQRAMDITEQILADHNEQRRMFALLDDIGDAADRLAPVWDRLTILLEVHAEAEERLFYPRLLGVGEGSAGADSEQEETKDALRDHDDIRDGIRRARAHEVGSREWWRAVEDTRISNSDHMAEEEREALADFRRHASLRARHDLGIEFAVYEAAHASGVSLTDRDPDRYVRDHAG